MTYVEPQAPQVNGIALLTEAEVLSIQAQLITMRENYEPTQDAPICDTFQLVCCYNGANVGSEINGDTCEYVLAYVSSEGTEGEA